MHPAEGAGGDQVKADVSSACEVEQVVLLLSPFLLTIRTEKYDLHSDRDGTGGLNVINHPEEEEAETKLRDEGLFSRAGIISSASQWRTAQGCMMAPGVCRAECVVNIYSEGQ
ncbi:hypothetical protein XENOCAPTIV_026251 [Xenoophorus captivus]|uniref:Uncharacterized protein n=1 Tax=Xenoophorus captivus TaxID=1517983 RepID=A0ABV0S3A3_9TELE